MLGIAGAPVLDRPEARRLIGALAVAAAAAILFAGRAGIIPAAPTQALLPVADWLGVAIGWFADTSRTVSRGLAALIVWPLERLRDALLWLPWPMLLALGALIGHASGGIRLMAFTAAALAYIVVTGLWPPSAVTLAVVGVAVPLAGFAGLLLGILAHRSRIAWRAIEPALDLMQTVPTLAYLLPVLALFGIGPMVAIVASAIYALPPMVRAVRHGLAHVPAEIVESGRMAGARGAPMLLWVLIPAALPTILLGLNQTIMAGLSMVVIASMIGGVSDIGIEVYQAMKQAKFGQSIVAGFVIVLIAMAMDRISRGLALGGPPKGAPEAARRRRELLLIAAVAVLCLPLAAAEPALWAYPGEWVLRPAAALDRALDAFTVWAFPVTSALKTWVTQFALLPLKIGLERSMRPQIWGIAMSDTVRLAYLALAAAGCLGLLAAGLRRGAAALAVFAVYYFHGTTGTPWPLTAALVVGLGWWAGGWRLAVLAAGALGFILLTGSWTRAMISVQLTFVGVVLAFVLGGAIGVAAALSDRVSSLVRPVCDTLQTMPIFVFLIPAVMVFLVGEFTALVAIVLYAIVPPIRYTELGIRQVPASLIEAARMMGVSRRQMLLRVQLPVALPEIALGLNQTIMLALAMVVVASLVGAPGLGQDVLVALSQGSAGAGLVAGLCIALIAIVADRILQAWSARQKRALGLAP